MTFQNNMVQTMQNIKKFPRLKEQIQNDLNQFKTENEKAKGEAGRIGSLRSKNYLKQYKNKQM